MLGAQIWLSLIASMALNCLADRDCLAVLSKSRLIVF